MVVEWLGPELVTYLLGKGLSKMMNRDRVAKAMRTVISDAIDRAAVDVTATADDAAAVAALLASPRRSEHPVPGAVVPVSGAEDNLTLITAITWWVELVGTGPHADFAQLGIDSDQLVQRLEFHMRDGIARLGGPGAPLEALHDRLVAADRHAALVAAGDQHAAQLQQIRRQLDDRTWRSGELFALPPAGTLNGRERDLAEVRRRIDAHPRVPGRPPIIVLHGMPGVGKTSFAACLARQHSRDGAAAVPFIELPGPDSTNSPVDTGTLLGELLVACGAVGADAVASPQLRATLWRSEVTRHGFPMIVLDNASSAEQVKALLPNQSGCVVVVTSRERLSDLEAVEYRLEPLSTSDTSCAFVTARTDAPREVVDRLASLTGGLPLANDIVLAALRRHEDLPMSFIADELAHLWDRHGVDRNARASDSPLSTIVKPVWTAFELSFSRLRESERQALSLLARQPGRIVTRFGLAALMGIPQSQAGFLLSELTSANLLVGRQGSQWRFHDLIAAFVVRHTEETVDSAQWEAAFRRLVRAQSEYATTVFAALESPMVVTRDGTEAAPPDVTAARDWLLSERGNLIAVLASCAAQPDDELAKTLIQLASHIGPSLWRYGYGDDARQCHEYSLTLARRIGNRAAEAAALLGLGYVERLQDEYEAAKGHYDAARLLYREVPDRLGEAESLTGLGHIDRLLGNYPQSQQYFLTAQAIYREAGQRLGQAHCRAGLAEVALMEGDLTTAITGYTAAKDIYAETGDHRGQAECHWGLGEVAQRGRELEEAQSHYTAANRHSKLDGYRLGEADSLRGIGEIAHLHGRHAEAFEVIDQAIALYRQIGDRQGEGLGLQSLGRVAAGTGDPVRAGSHWRTALAIFEDINAPAAAQLRQAIALISRAQP